jgi:hypothetical protein
MMIRPWYIQVVQVVVRPCKSWYWIAYTDHDWAKDTQRSLLITTLITICCHFEASLSFQPILGDVPVCQTISTLTGPAMSLIKIHYFKGSEM